MTLGYLSTRDQNRFRLDGCEKTMKAVITTDKGEQRPLVAQTFVGKKVGPECIGCAMQPAPDTVPLERIADAQRVFLEKNHFEKFVLIPSGVSQDPRMK